MGITAVGTPDTPATDDERTAAELEALLLERRGYLARQLLDRVAQVDAQIKLRGGTIPKGPKD